MRKKKRRLFFGVFALLLGICTGMAGDCILKMQPALATSLEDKLKKAGEKIDELEESIDNADDEISSYQAKQEEIEQEIKVKQERIRTLSQELDETRTALEEKQEEIEKTQAQLEESIQKRENQYEHMKLRIRFMYERSTDSVLSYILEAGSFAEAMRRANYFQSVTAYDRQKMEEYKALAKKIRGEKAALQEEKKELDALEASQEEKLAQIDEELDELKSDLQKKLAQLKKTKAQRKQYKQELKRQKEYEEELERQKAEEDRKRLEEIRRQEEELARQKEEQERKKEQAQAESGSSSGSNSDSAGTASSADPYSASSRDLELLSTIIYCEAGGEPYKGQVAVGSVVMNRVASSSFPNTITGVIYQSGQFSPVASGRFASALAQGLGSHCIQAAQEVLSGTRNVSCLYFRRNNGLINGTIIGHHVFY